MVVDWLVWVPQSKGTFSVSSCYKFLLTSNTLDQNYSFWPWRQIWKIQGTIQGDMFLLDAHI
uniref:Putative ovule protein n=1 Tax=Solanum chacoense TaxID=4108 RepID=A0A0V0HQ81_SOLCH